MTVLNENRRLAEAFILESIIKYDYQILPRNIWNLFQQFLIALPVNQLIQDPALRACVLRFGDKVCSALKELLGTGYEIVFREVTK